MGRGGSHDPQFFPPKENPTVGLLPEWDDLRERVFHCCWVTHGGSGLNLSWGDALNCTLSDLQWVYERVTKERKTEAEAIRLASKRGR